MSMNKQPVIIEDLLKGERKRFGLMVKIQMSSHVGRVKDREVKIQRQKILELIRVAHLRAVKIQIEAMDQR